MDFIKGIKEYYGNLINTIERLDKEEINRVINILLEQYNKDGVVYIFGNGGSSATASHFVSDFNKGISGYLDKKFRLFCLNDNVPSIMAIANDISFDDVFSFQLNGRICKDDLVIAISGSGNSSNIIKAVEVAKKAGCIVIGITGYNGGYLKELSDYSLHVDICDMQIVEDVHMSFDHMIMRVLGSYLGEVNGA